MLVVGACTGQGHRCVESERTIEHGIYGEVAYRTLEGGDTPLYHVPVSLTEEGGLATVQTESNEDGLYEFALPKTTQGLPPSFTEASSMFPNAEPQTYRATVEADLLRVDLVVEEGHILWRDYDFPDCP